MHFHPNEPFDRNNAERQAWDQLKSACTHDEGVAYYRYPLFSGRGSQKREPDILIIHRGNIVEICGQEWIMHDWYRDRMTPVAQADGQMYEVKTMVERHPELRQPRLPFEFRVVLPFVTRQQWETRDNLASNPAIRGARCGCTKNLAPRALRDNFGRSGGDRMPPMKDALWELLIGVFRGVVRGSKPRLVPTGSPDNCRIVQKLDRRGLTSILSLSKRRGEWLI